MDKSAQNEHFTDDQFVVEGLGRRSFLGLLGGGVLGAGLVTPAGARQEPPSPNRLWNWVQVYIGNSTEEQSPSPIIKCPIFFANGHYAYGSHTLDLSDYPNTVIGDMTLDGVTFKPDFSPADAAFTQDFHWALTGGETEVTNGEGPFEGATKAIHRCKYKIDPRTFGLISCVYCVLILLRG